MPIRNEYRRLIGSSFEFLGFAAVLTTLASFFLSPSIQSKVECYKPSILILLLILAILWALYRNKKKEIVELKVRDNLKIKLYYDDILKANGIVVIPVNDFFDTLVDDKIVSSHTLHGKFIKEYFGGNISALEDKITKGLSNCKPISFDETRQKNRYALGTISKVKQAGKIFYLIALTRFNENNRAEISNDEYKELVSNLLYYIEQNSQGELVNIPLLGSGHSGVRLRKQKLLEYILISFYIADNLTLNKGVNIVLHKNLKKEINLSKIESSYNDVRGEYGV